MRLEPASPESVGMSARQLAHVETLAQRWIDDGSAGGIVMLVARRGKIVLQGAFGRRAPDVDEPPALDTLFPWGSASTLITITSAMALVDDGVLGRIGPFALLSFILFSLSRFQRIHTRRRVEPLLAAARAVRDPVAARAGDASSPRPREKTPCESPSPSFPS